MVQVLKREYEPSFGEQFSRQVGSGVSKGIEQRLQHDLKNPSHERLKKAFIQHGATPEEAELYTQFTTGGQTAAAKEFLEKKKREIQTPVQTEDEELNEIVSSQDKGLTPSEKVARGKERYASGLKIYEEAGDKLRGFAANKRGFDILKKLNESGKLPQGLGRVNVDKNGNLKLPFLSSPEAQRYVKTFNEFISGAKGTFGARVTNFDLETYLKQFPTLLNSEEGRQQLIDQMEIINDINSVYYKNLKNVFNKAGGVRKIDSDVAESFAERKSEKEVESLVKKFDTIGIPNASKNVGRRIVDDSTGAIFESNGSEWIQVE